jgi:hypothetical protein
MKLRFYEGTVVRCNNRITPGMQRSVDLKSALSMRPRHFRRPHRSRGEVVTSSPLCQVPVSPAGRDPARLRDLSSLST